MRVRVHACTCAVAAAFADNLARYEAGGVAALQHVFDWDTGY
jgi:hypothetical protein